MRTKKISKLKAMRLKLRLSQVAMARRLHISQPSYSIAEWNGVKQITTLQRYAAALGCDWKDLAD